MKNDKDLSDSDSVAPDKDLLEEFRTMLLSKGCDPWRRESLEQTDKLSDLVLEYVAMHGTTLWRGQSSDVLIDMLRGLGVTHFCRMVSRTGT